MIAYDLILIATVGYIPSNYKKGAVFKKKKAATSSEFSINLLIDNRQAWQFMDISSAFEKQIFPCSIKKRVFQLPASK
jgi:hypothetical protein